MKVLRLIVAFVLAFALSACGTVFDENPRDTIIPREFLTLVHLDEYEGASSERTWQWADEESLTTAEVGDELRFIFGYLRGTYRVELKEWNTTGGHVDDLPFILDYDEGNAQDVRTFDWVPEEEGDYHFSLWLSNQSGQPRADTPIELIVRVGDEASSPDDGLKTMIRWFNVTDSDGVAVEDGDTIEPARAAGGVSVNWSVAQVDKVEVTVTSRGSKLFSSDVREHSRWIPFDSIDNSNVVVELRITDGNKSYAQTIRFEVR